MQLFNHQQKYASGYKDNELVVHEAGCLHPDTLIYDPVDGTNIAVKDRSTSFYVWSKNEEGELVIARAEAPQAFYPSSFVDIHFANSASISVTPEHRIWNGVTYVTARELETSFYENIGRNAHAGIFARLFGSSLSHLPTSSALSPSGSLRGVRHYLQKVVDYLDGYLERHRSYDQQPLSGLNSDRDVSPLRYDVFEPYYFACPYKGDQGHKQEYNLSYQCVSRPAKSNFYLPERNIEENAFQNLALKGNAGQGLYSTLILFLWNLHFFLVYIIRSLFVVLFRLIWSLPNLNKKTRITKVERVQSNEVYYDFYVPYYNNYYAAGVIHHNTGKTICACVWLKDGRDEDALVICPKRVKKKWKDELDRFGVSATILSMEEFKKTEHRPYSAIVVDEVDEFASPLFVAKQRSKRTEHLYELIREKNENTPRLLMSATPIRSHPWNLHTLLTLKGHYIDWKKWRERFFELTSRPYLSGKAWLPKPDWRQKIRPILEEHADIVLMSDIIDIPSEVNEYYTVKSTIPELEEWEPAARFHEERRYEQENKVKHIKDIAREYRKVLVVAYYREQCDKLAETLEKERETYLVHGGVTEQETLLKQANETDECYLVVQASLGAGFDADTFNCVIFASCSYSVRDHIQMKRRVRRIHNLHPVAYYYLSGGRCDTAVLQSIEKGLDFVPGEWAKKTYESSEITQKEKETRG